MRRLLSTVSLLLLLTACTPAGPQASVTKEPIKPILPVTESSSVASVHQTSSDEPLENADMEAAPDKSTDSSSALVIAERILDTGVLELGSATAPVTMLSFTNYSCRYCSQFDSEEFGRLLQGPVMKGKIRYQIAILKLKKYPQSLAQTKALLCAAEQHKGLAMHRYLFTAKADMSGLNGAKTLKLDLDAYRGCLADKGMDRYVQAEEDLSTSLSVTAVPTFIINGTKLTGLYRFAELTAEMEKAGKK